MENHEYKEYLDAALVAAKEAGNLIKFGFERDKNITFKDITDMVTDTDRQCEITVVDYLKNRFPGHSFLGEESVSLGISENTLGNEPTWIIDPIDGTTNFVSQFPFTCVSIALAINKELVVGVVYNPILDELFSAVKGQGAFLNGNPIHVKSTTNLKESLVTTGFPYARDDEPLDRILGNVQEVLKVCRDVRRPGACALDLCYVAKGVFDVHYEELINAWDIAAGALIVIEAGGTVENMYKDGFDLLGCSVVSGNPSIVKSLKSVFCHFPKQ